MTPFQETLHHFSEQLGAPLPEGEYSEGVELAIEGNPVSLYPGEHPDTVVMEVPVALFETPITEEHLLELCRLHYLGADTNGCSLTLDSLLLSLKAVSTPGTAPQENWDWLQRLLGSAQHLAQLLDAWKEASPLFSLKGDRV